MPKDLKAETDLRDAWLVAAEVLIEHLQADARLYHDLVLALRKLQRSTDGPLTAWLAALVEG